MIELPAFLLALCFVVVGAAAWLLGRRQGAARTVRLPQDYYVGLDHLVNDRFDRAAEVFARMAEGGEATEIEFTLASLFRRRGEVDRAIAIHTRLRDRSEGPLRDQAAFALALDYLSAGLMDRAERLLQELTGSAEYRRRALDHLLRIYEQQADWASALETFRQLPPAVQLERRRAAAHYLCELAEQALLQEDTDRARSLLQEARSHDPELPRAAILAARVVETDSDPRPALELYLQALEASPGLALEIIPRALALARTLGESHVIGELESRLRRTGRFTPRQVAWLLATAVPALPRQELTDAFPGLLAIGSAADSSSHPGPLLGRSGDAGARYQCDDCGLHSVGWYWRCPKCRAWDSMRPAVFGWPERNERGARAT